MPVGSPLVTFDGAAHALLSLPGGVRDPAISPDGKMLAFVGYATSGFDLFAMPLPSPGSSRTVAGIVVTDRDGAPARRRDRGRTGEGPDAGAGIPDGGPRILVDPARRSPGSIDAMSTIRRIGDTVTITADQARAFLASPSGVRFRKLLAGAVIVTAPLLFRAPGVRRYPLFRALEAIGGVALVIKAAEALRDWELSGGRADRIVIDVPPAS
jgi:hypothetical protein